MLALVTGASRGIGRAVAIELAKNNFDVAINFNRSEEQALKLCDEVKNFGVEAEIFKADDNTILIDQDVASLYPSIIIEIFPLILFK